MNAHGAPALPLLKHHITYDSTTYYNVFSPCFPLAPRVIFLIVAPTNAAMRADVRQAVFQTSKGENPRLGAVEKARDVKAFRRQFRDSAMNEDRKGRFEKAATQRDQWLLVEYMRFLSRNKKYWLIPVVAFLLLIGLLVMLGGGVAGAFIYPVF
jgi:hypothetical protein